MEEVKPLRLQRKRVKGYKMVHDNGLENYYVGRPGQFGSMLKIDGDMMYISTIHRRALVDEWMPVMSSDSFEKMQMLYRAIMTDTVHDLTFFDEILDLYDVNFWVKSVKELDLSILKGKNLFCFCPVGFQYCHANVLLELANK